MRSSVAFCEVADVSADVLGWYRVVGALWMGTYPCVMNDVEGIALRIQATKHIGVFIPCPCRVRHPINVSLNHFKEMAIQSARDDDV